MSSGIGGNFTFYRVPEPIQLYYGEHPVGLWFFLRARLKGTDPMAHMHHL